MSEVFAAGGNPYGTSYTSGKTVEGPDAKRSLPPDIRGNGWLALRP